MINKSIECKPLSYSSILAFKSQSNGILTGVCLINSQLWALYTTNRGLCFIYDCVLDRLIFSLLSLKLIGDPAFVLATNKI